MTLYKWVPERFIVSTLRGKLRIGTLLGYAKLENGRNDDHEGFVSLSPSGISLKHGEVHPARAGLARMGLHLFGAVEIHGSVHFSTTRADAYCFCLTEDPGSQTLQASEERQAVIEISQPEELCRLISIQSPRLQYKTALMGPVEYADYTAEGLATGTGRVDAQFMKRRTRPDGYFFEGEREHRMIWTDGKTYMAGETGEMNSYPPLTGFFTRPTKQIARQLTRVA